MKNKISYDILKAKTYMKNNNCYDLINSKKDLNVFKKKKHFKKDVREI